MITDLEALKKAIAAWWEGKFVPYENDPNSAVFFCGGNQECHWTSSAAHVLAKFWLKHWQWTIGIMVAVGLGLLKFL
jgi:hypothetical protein